MPGPRITLWAVVKEHAQNEELLKLKARKYIHRQESSCETWSACSKVTVFDKYRSYAFDDDSKPTEHIALKRTQPHSKYLLKAPSIDQLHMKLSKVPWINNLKKTKSQTQPRQRQQQEGQKPSSHRSKGTRSANSSPSSCETPGKGSSHRKRFNSASPYTKTARERFRRATRIVLILLKWISTLSERRNMRNYFFRMGGEGVDGQDGGRTFTDIANEAFISDELRKAGLSFDLSEFKARREEMNITMEVKTILSIPAIQRTPDQIQTAIIGLQQMKSFAEYPLHMQERLCNVAWFQEVPPKRVIIRQGHLAENFYFILAGTAVVRILEKNEETGDVQLRTAAIIKKGTSFGELALLHRSLRTATVVSQDRVQLLAIGRDDFFRIFMLQPESGEMPDHVRFASTLEFMRDWPVSKLLEHPEFCLFHFFKRGFVIVKDSLNSEWLYIVKSGSCQVMKELKRAQIYATGIKRKTRMQTITASLPRLAIEIRPKVDTGRFSRKPYTCTPTETTRIERLEQLNIKKKDTTPVPELPADVRLESVTSESLSGIWSRASRRKSPRTKTARKEEGEVPSELRAPVFVQVELLKPKDCFGLISIKFDEVEVPETSVSLVSNGAECIMLSKKFFTLHTNDKVKQVIRYIARPYPSEESLQGILQDKVNWELYKKKLIDDMMAQKSKEQMLSSYTT